MPVLAFVTTVPRPPHRAARHGFGTASCAACGEPARWSPETEDSGVAFCDECLERARPDPGAELGESG